VHATPLSADQLSLIGDLRAKEYAYQIRARGYVRTMRFYINLGRLLDFLGIAVSISFLYFRYLTAKAALTHVETLIGWIALGLSVLFIILAIWRLIFAWSRNIETLPDIARAAQELCSLFHDACELPSPTRTDPLVISCRQKDTEFEQKLYPNPLRSHIRKAFQDTCRTYPHARLQCYVCMNERTPYDFRRKIVYIPFLHCRQCGGSMKKTIGG
jgi:mobilome CxxCx(11)CxxC protein